MHSITGPCIFSGSLPYAQHCVQHPVWQPQMQQMHQQHRSSRFLATLATASGGGGGGDLARRQRDPASYRSMDDLRAELQGGGAGRAGLITGAINWLGRAANVARSAASPLQAAYQGLLEYQNRRDAAAAAAACSSSGNEEFDEADVSAAA